MITEITGIMLFPFAALNNTPLVPGMYLCLLNNGSQTYWGILEYSRMGVFMLEEEDTEILGFFRLQGEADAEKGVTQRAQEAGK